MRLYRIWYKYVVHGRLGVCGYALAFQEIEFANDTDAEQYGEKEFRDCFEKAEPVFTVAPR